MNKFISAVCTVLAVTALFCSFSRRPPDIVTGHVNMYGSMPFAFPGFETTDGRHFTLVLDKKKSGTITIHELESLQGQLVELHGVINTGSNADKSGINRLHDGEFVVYSYKIITPHKN
jgi:hypothetical protein